MITTHPTFIVTGQRGNTYLVPIDKYEKLARPATADDLSAIVVSLDANPHVPVYGRAVGVGLYARDGETQRISVLPVGTLPVLNDSGLGSLVWGATDAEIGEAMVEAARAVLQADEARIAEATQALACRHYDLT